MTGSQGSGCGNLALCSRSCRTHLKCDISSDSLSKLAKSANLAF